MTPHRIRWKSEEFQICIAAASCAFWHAAMLIMVHLNFYKFIIH